MPKAGNIPEKYGDQRWGMEMHIESCAQAEFRLKIADRTDDDQGVSDNWR